MFVEVDGNIINESSIEYVGPFYGSLSHPNSCKFTIYLKSGKEITFHQEPQLNSPKIIDIYAKLLRDLTVPEQWKPV
jgi:hypothetical protein